MARLLILSALSLLIASCDGLRQRQAPNHAEAVEEQASTSAQTLREELLEMMAVDQEARFATLDYRREHPGEELDPKLIENIRTIDARNRARMHEIVDQFGWPDNEIAGEDGAHAAWLLVQHADDDVEFQERCLEQMTRARERGTVSAIDHAYLTDRVRVNRDRPQLYGTQFHEVDGRMQPQPIEDEAGLDARREALGLPTMAEYRAQIEAMQQGRLSPSND